MKNSVNLQYYNHNLSSLINLGIDKNFILNKFKEVKPNTNNLKLFSKLNTETKVPSYIILEFEKQKSTYDYVLEKIENLERNWVYELSEKENKFHSFGRVPEDGNSVGFWSVPKRTANFLKTMIEVTNSKVILELGTSVGYSTLHMAKAIEHNEHAHIFGTEILSKKIKLAKNNFKCAGLNNKITLFEKDIKYVLDNWNINKKINFVFMDADKENYNLYFETLLSLISKNGIIVVDNVGRVLMTDGSYVDCEYMNKFKSKILSDKRVFSKYYDFDNGILLIFKK